MRPVGGDKDLSRLNGAFSWGVFRVIADLYDDRYIVVSASCENCIIVAYGCIAESSAATLTDEV